MSDNVVWQPGEVSRSDRARLLGHGGATVWLTGLPAAGKTTIAVAVEAALIARGVLSYRLDGDNVRHGICADLGFDAHARDENIRRVGEISKLFADAGLVVLASFISPYRDGRAQVRAIHEAAKIPFVEVFVDCPLEVAEARDPKGMYARARAGEIHDFTGVDAPYEAPLSADLHLRSDEHTLDDEVARVIGALTAVIGA